LKRVQIEYSLYYSAFQDARTFEPGTLNPEPHDKCGIKLDNGCRKSTPPYYKRYISKKYDEIQRK